MKVLVSGLGLVGAYLIDQLVDLGFTEFIFHDKDLKKMRLFETKYTGSIIVEGLHDVTADISIIASPANTHLKSAKLLLQNGSHVVSITDSLQETEDLLELDELANNAGLTLTIGAGFMPGLSCLLVRLACEELDVVNNIMVAKVGTAGPACARQHHHALNNVSLNWFDDQWLTERGGTGRVLLWFPEPIGAKDCYRSALPSPVLIRSEFPDVARISARMEANRRDRLTSKLPMLRPPHADGGPGAIRAEVRGSKEGSMKTVVYAVMDSPALATAKLAAQLVDGISRGQAPLGAKGVINWDQPKDILRKLVANGVVVSKFDS